MMPMLAGSHVDAGMTASNHATKHKSIVRALVLAGNNEVATDLIEKSSEDWETGAEKNKFA